MGSGSAVVSVKGQQMSSTSSVLAAQAASRRTCHADACAMQTGEPLPRMLGIQIGYDPHDPAALVRASREQRAIVAGAAIPCQTSNRASAGHHRCHGDRIAGYHMAAQCARLNRRRGSSRSSCPPNSCRRPTAGTRRAASRCVPPATALRSLSSSIAVDHRVADAGRIVDVVERVLVEDDEVGELARLDRAEVVVEAVRARRVDRRGAQRLAGCSSRRARSPRSPSARRGPRAGRGRRSTPGRRGR